MPGSVLGSDNIKFNSVEEKVTDSPVCTISLGKQTKIVKSGDEFYKLGGSGC